MQNKWNEECHAQICNRDFFFKRRKKWCEVSSASADDGKLISYVNTEMLLIFRSISQAHYSIIQMQTSAAHKSINESSGRTARGGGGVENHRAKWLSARYKHTIHNASTADRYTPSIHFMHLFNNSTVCAFWATCTICFAMWIDRRSKAYYWRHGTYSIPYWSLLFNRCCTYRN